MTGTKAYITWAKMINRCGSRTTNKKSIKNYIARGITVCDRWKSFENFYADMGEPPTPKHSIDRINNNGPYSPENCRWASVKEQQNNKRNNRFITFSGDTKTIAQWSEFTGIPYSQLSMRIKKYGIESALGRS